MLIQAFRHSEFCQLVLDQCRKENYCLFDFITAQLNKFVVLSISEGFANIVLVL